MIGRRAPNLAAVAALFVSLMSVRVPHRPEKHEYNKMKMKDTCAGWQRVWGGAAVWVELMCLCSILHRMLPCHFGNVSLTSVGEEGRTVGEGRRGGRSSSGSWLRDDGVSFK